jgi:hypothetical protein
MRLAPEGLTDLSGWWDCSVRRRLVASDVRHKGKYTDDGRGVKQVGRKKRKDERRQPSACA